MLNKENKIVKQRVNHIQKNKRIWQSSCAQLCQMVMRHS